MRYSISQVAKASGISARMLRHYDAIGLLAPSEVATNGYRWYGRGELLRLRRILLLRGLGIGLKEIREIVTDETDEATSLVEHLVMLRDERDRIDRAITTVKRTIADLEQVKIVDPAEFFVGLRAHQETMRESYIDSLGPAVHQIFDTAIEATNSFTPADYEHQAAQSAILFRGLAETMERGVEPTDPEALDAVAKHHQAISRFWQPTPQAYAELGQLYVTDPAQRSLAAEADPRLPAWLADAIKAYSWQRLRASTAS